VHKTPYPLLRGVRDGTRYSSPFTVFIRGTGRRVVESRTAQRVCPGHRGLGHFSRCPEVCYSENPHCAIIIYNIKNPQEKKSTTYPKTSPIKTSHHQCADPGIDPIDSPHPRIQYSGPLQKDPHPEPGSDRALTPSRTRIPRPLAIAREHRRSRSNPTTYPSSLPRALGKLTGNIPSQGH